VSDLYGRRGKRLVDVVGASLALIVTAPIQIAAATAVAATMGKPVLFRQQRPGKNGQPFTLIKLRTMRSAQPNAEGEQSDELRLTRLGVALRSSSVDELPELWNVLKGDMSLVGPRPLLIEYLPLYTPVQARRHEVRPGITGWAQVNGRNAISWDEKFELDVWYVDHVSLSLDVRIAWLTVLKVLRRQGISSDGHATAPRFEGVRASA